MSEEERGFLMRHHQFITTGVSSDTAISTRSEPHGKAKANTDDPVSHTAPLMSGVLRSRNQEHDFWAGDSFSDTDPVETLPVFKRDPNKPRLGNREEDIESFLHIQTPAHQVLGDLETQNSEHWNKEAFPARDKLHALCVQGTISELDYEGLIQFICMNPWRGFVRPSMRSRSTGLGLSLDADWVKRMIFGKLDLDAHTGRPWPWMQSSQWLMEAEARDWLTPNIIAYLRSEEDKRLEDLVFTDFYPETKPEVQQWTPPKIHPRHWEQLRLHLLFPKKDFFIGPTFLRKPFLDTFFKSHMTSKTFSTSSFLRDFDADLQGTWLRQRLRIPERYFRVLFHNKGKISFADFPELRVECGFKEFPEALKTLPPW